MPLDREADQRIAIEKANDALQFAVQAKDTFFAELRETAGNGFDCQSKIVGDIAAGNHHVKFAIAWMTVGHFADKGRDALQCALLGDDELFVLRIGKIRQGNVQKIDGNDGVMIGAKGRDAGFADGFGKIGAYIARFKPEPFALSVKRQNVSLSGGRQPIDPHSARFYVVDRKRVFAFAVDRLIGLEPNRLIFGCSGCAPIPVASSSRVIYCVILKHLRRPYPDRSISNCRATRYSRYPLRIATEAPDYSAVYKAFALWGERHENVVGGLMASEEGGKSDLSQDPASVREQLERILASPQFHAPERGRRFLQYIVEETLEGHSERLKAYMIAQVVFGRDASFDAQNDPVVRIEAGRIRRALERYYLVCGSNDPIRITIPKGGYATQFSSGENTSIASEVAASQDHENLQSQTGQQGPTTYRHLLLPIGVPALFGAMAILALIRPLESYLSPPQATRTPVASTPTNRIRITVDPLVALDGTVQTANFAKGLGDQLIAKLMEVQNLVVLTPGRSGAVTSGPHFNLQGSALVESTIVHLHIRLIDGADGVVVWANQYDRDLSGQTILDVEDDIAVQIAMEISKFSKLGDAGP